MPKRVIETGPDFLSGEHEGVSSTIDGRLFLANRNLLPDATFSKFAPAGGLEDFDPPSFPKLARAWNLYVATPSDPTTFALWGNRLPLSRAAYTFSGSSAGSGAFPPASSQRPDLDAPPAPTGVEVVEADRGYAEGYYNLAYCLILNALVGPEALLTTPSPRVEVQVTGSDKALSVSGALAEAAVSAGMAAVGVAVYATEVQATTTGLSTAPLYQQEIIALDDGGAFSALLAGPWREGELAPTSNATYVGAYEAEDPPDWSLEPVAGSRMDAMQLQLSWSFRTASGWSAAQQITPDTSYIDLPARNEVGVMVRPPYRPAGALAWRPEWRNAPSGSSGAGSWYTYVSEYDFASAAYLYTAEPTSGNVGATAMKSIQRSATDNTGALVPDTAPTVTTTALASTNAGDYLSKATTLYDEGLTVLPQGVSQSAAQSAPSATTTTSLTSQGELVVARPPQGSRVPNPEFRERNITGYPRFWTPLLGDTDLTFTFGDGVATCSDTSNNTTTRSVLASHAIPLSDDTEPFALRCKLTVTSQTGGTVTLAAIQEDADGVSLQETTLHTTTNGSDLALSQFTFGPTGADYGRNADAVAIKLVVKHGANASVGAYASWQLSYLALYDGWVVPPKRAVDSKGFAVDTDGDADSAADPYPASGYFTVVENPSTRPSALNSVTTNMLEYYAPYGTELETERPPKGLKLPVRPGQTYTLSFYAMVRGVTNGTELCYTDFRDDDGNLIQPNEPLVAYTGSGARFTNWTRYNASFLAPADAAYMEFSGSLLGAGLVRLMGLQFEKGSSATAFDPGSLPEGGVGTATVTIDVGVDDTPNPVRNLSDVGTVTGFEMIGHSDDGEVSYELRSTSVNPDEAGEEDWSEWVTDVDDLLVDRIQRYVQVRFTLTEPEV